MMFFEMENEGYLNFHQSQFVKTEIPLIIFS